MQQKTLCKDWYWGKILLGALYISIAVAVVATVMLAVPRDTPDQPKVYLGGEKITVTVLNTKELQEVGLSGRKSLGKNEGLLFNFPEPGFHGIWMKDMLFPIDVIWFNNDKIVDVWENASPDSYPKVYTPIEKATIVLEVNAGFVSEHHLKTGDMLGRIK